MNIASANKLELLRIAETVAQEKMIDPEIVVEAMEEGRRVLTREDVMDGVAELVDLVQVEATFPDGTKMISCHDPIV